MLLLSCQANGGDKYLNCAKWCGLCTLPFKQEISAGIYVTETPRSDSVEKMKVEY